jgi:hypothetical protein
VEKDKDRLDRILEDLARMGLIEFPVTDEFVSAFERAGLSEKLDDAEIYELYRVVRSTYLTEALQAAKASLPKGPQTLGDILRHALAKTKVTDTELADHLSIDLRTLRAVESNDYDPTRLPVPSLVNVMEMCLLRIGEIVAALQHSLRVMAERTGHWRLRPLGFNSWEPRAGGAAGAGGRRSAIQGEQDDRCPWGSARPYRCDQARGG